MKNDNSNVNNKVSSNEEKIEKGITVLVKAVLKFLAIGVIVVIIGAILMIGIAFFVIKNDNSSLKHKYDIVYKNDVVTLINDNSELPVNYMVKYHEIMKEKYIRFDYSFNDSDSVRGGYKLENKSEGVKLYYYGYPYDSQKNNSNYYLGEINISKDKYNVLGITPGKTTLDEATKILEDNKFEPLKKEESNVTYKKEDYNISLVIKEIIENETTSKIISNIRVYVD